MRKRTVLRTIPQRKTTGKIVKRLAGAILSVFLLLLIGLGYASWQWGRTTVTIKNDSDRAVSNVEIALDNGEPYALGQLLPGQSCSERIYPPGEAAVQINFVSERGTARKTSPKMYVEASGGYRAKYTIGKDSLVKCQYDTNFLL
jgi:hypothetical protein